MGVLLVRFFPFFFHSLFYLAQSRYSSWFFSFIFSDNTNRKKGYAGTAILSKIEPITKSIDLLVNGEYITGRLVQLEFPTLFLIGTYVGRP